MTIAERAGYRQIKFIAGNFTSATSTFLHIMITTCVFTCVHTYDTLFDRNALPRIKCPRLTSPAWTIWPRLLPGGVPALPSYECGTTKVNKWLDHIDDKQP